MSSVFTVNLEAKNNNNNKDNRRVNTHFKQNKTHCHTDVFEENPFM